MQQKGIYCYTDKKTSEIVYIGKDSHIDENLRHKQHIQPSRYDAQPFNRVLQNNPDRYVYDILFQGKAEHIEDKLLSDIEIGYIATYNPKFCYTEGGEGISGYNHSESTKKKMSENNVRYWEGKKLPEEHKQQISKTLSETKNTTGFFRVSKFKNSNKRGWGYLYVYYDDGNRRQIRRKYIDDLEHEVLNRGEKWLIIDEENEKMTLKESRLLRLKEEKGGG